MNRNSFLDKIKFFSSKEKEPEKPKKRNTITSNKNNIYKTNNNDNIKSIDNNNIERTRTNTIASNYHSTKLNQNPIKNNNENNYNKNNTVEKKPKNEYDNNIFNKTYSSASPYQIQEEEEYNNLYNTNQSNEIPNEEVKICSYNKEEFIQSISNKEQIEPKLINDKIEIKSQNENWQKLSKFKTPSLENNFIFPYRNDIYNDDTTTIDYTSNSSFNIIYLIDTTLSMKKYETFIYSLEKINSELAKKFINIKIGYVLYKDFKDKKENDPNKHIKIHMPSNLNIKIPKDIVFSGGYDYSEDWAISIYYISVIANQFEENIVIHICDSNAHGARFSDYDNNNDQEEILIKALLGCITKNIKFIGLLIDDFARKSFFECKKIYNENNGFYDVVDLTKNFDYLNYKLLLSKIIEKITNILKKEYIIYDKDWYNTYFLDINESNFEFKGLIIEMKPLYDISQYKFQNFTFLPKTKINNLNSYVKLDKMYGIAQGYIGDCYLISSILSMMNIPLIFNYIFPNSLNIDEKAMFIEMFIYENGIRKLISFKNTYAIYKGQLLFVKPYNNEIYGLAIEKGYSVSKCTDKTIKSGYKNIEGGYGYKVFETILGAQSEKYISNNVLFNLIYHNGYKFITKENLKYKIKKYIDLGGIITFAIYYNLGSAHEYSIQGYKLDKNGDLLVEIINPHRKGRYAEENIYFSKDDNKEKLIISDRKYPIIFEDDFVNIECKESLYSYKKTGYLIMEFETFFRWYGCIDICDPMIGSYEEIVEYIPNGNNIHSFDFILKAKTKFKAYIFIKNNSLNINNYNLIIKYKRGNIIYNDELDNNNKIFYEILEKGFYIIEIKSKKNQEIKDVIYLKIYSYEQLETIEKEKKYNDIINFGNFYKNCYSEMIFIEEFIIKYYKFICNNNHIFFIELPNVTSIYYNPNNIIKNFFIYYINTIYGFYVEVIFKYKWKFLLIMEYRYNCDYYLIYTKFGNFKCSRNFYFYDFDIEFKKNVFRGKYSIETILWSEVIHFETHSSLSNIIFNNINNLIEYDNRKIINYQINNKVDVIFLIDSTGSMESEIKFASNFAIENAKNLSKSYPHNDFQFGIIYYNDPIDCSTDFNDFLQLTKDLEKIKQFCNNWKTQNGGDEAEDWAGGYSIALNDIYWRDGKRIIVHICDSPAHGTKYSKKSGDNHREKQFEDQLDDLMKKCAENKIIIVGIYKTVSAQNCFLECKKIYENNKGLAFNIQFYNPNSRLNLNI